MTYEQAFKIGSKIEGYVKCTFAELWSMTDGRLFTIQQIHTKKSFDRKEQGDAILDAVSGEPDYDSSIVLEYELPVVVCSRYDQNTRMVYVQLTGVAKNLILRMLEGKNNFRQIKKTKYSVYEVSNPYKRENGVTYYATKTLQFVTYTKPKAEDYTEDKYVIETEEVDFSPYTELIELMKSDGEFLVKKCALDWMPLNVENATIQKTDENGNVIEINLNDKIAAAKAKMEQAKKLLIAAGLGALI